MKTEIGETIEKGIKRGIDRWSINGWTDHGEGFIHRRPRFLGWNCRLDVTCRADAELGVKPASDVTRSDTCGALRWKKNR